MKAILAWVGVIALTGCGLRSSLDGSDEPRVPPSIFVDSSAVDFGTVDCRSTPGAHLIALRNESTRRDADPGTWTAEVTGPFHLLGPVGGLLAAGTDGFLQVAPDPVVTAAAGDEVEGKITIRTNDPSRAMTEIPLRLESRGAVLIVPATETFSLEKPTTQTKILTFKNVGNVKVDVTVGMPSLPDFSVISASEAGKGVDKVMHLAPNGTDRATVRFETDLSGVRMATLPVAVAGPVCGSIPTSIKLIGSGVEGPLAVSGDLDYGKLQCGQTPPTRSIKVTNITAAPLAFSVHSLGGYPPTINPSGGTLSAGESVDVQITPFPIPQNPSFSGNFYSGIVEVQAGSSKYDLSLHQEPWGAALDILGPPFSVHAGLGGSLVTVPIRNGGNEPVRISASGPTAYIDPQTLPVGDSSLSMFVSVRPDEIGVIHQQTAALTLLSGGPFCGPPSLNLVYRPYALAVSVAATVDNFCVASPSALYCEGTNSLLGLGFAIGPHWLGPASVGTTTDVKMGAKGTCWNDSNVWNCAALDGSSTVHFALSTGGGLYVANGAFHECLDSGLGFSCRGTNPSGQWGNGATSASFSLVPSPAMGGSTGVSSYSASDQAGYAIRNGVIFAAGMKSGGNLGNTSVPDGVITTPVAVTGISDALEVSAFADGACAVRANGSVVCWNTSHGVTARGSFTNATSVVALGFDDFCVRQANGGASCWNGTSVVPLNGLVTPVQRLAYRPGLVFAVEGDGAVSRGAPDWLSHARIMGFDGP